MQAAPRWTRTRPWPGIQGSGYLGGVDGNQAGRGRGQLRVIPGGMEPGDRPRGDASGEDADHVLRGRAGDTRAREVLFKRRLRMLRHRVCRLLGPDPESEDIV